MDIQLAIHFELLNSKLDVGYAPSNVIAVESLY